MIAEILIVGACSFFNVSHNAAINPHPGVHYVACRWNYSAIAADLDIPRSQVKHSLKHAGVIVTNRRTGKSAVARIADWGPAAWTKRKADLSPRLMKTLNLKTDDIVDIRVKLMRKGASTW